MDDPATRDGLARANNESAAMRWRRRLLELRRRHIFKIAVAYLVVAWLLMQVASVLETSLGLPPWADKLTFLLLLVGFPIALILTWAVDLAPSSPAAENAQSPHPLPQANVAAASPGLHGLPGAEANNDRPPPRDAVFATNSTERTDVSPMFRRPAVAVLPFKNMSGDPDQEYFADGLTEDLITALSLWRSFPVIARNSTFAFKGQSPDIREVGDKLGANYVIEGSVRKSGGKVRTTAQLIDAKSGHHLWAERYDHDFADVFKIQDELSQRIAATVAPEVDFTILKHPETYTPTNISAWDSLQRGLSRIFELDLAAIWEGRAWLEKAIALDPKYARVFVGLGWSYHRELWLDRSEGKAELKRKLYESASRAVALDPFDAETHIIMAFAYNWMGDVESGLQSALRAVDLNPNNAQGYGILGHEFALVGKPDEAIASQAKAVFLSPRDPRQGAWMFVLGLAYLTARQYEDAVLWSQRAIQRHPKNADAHIILASALGRLGQLQEGRLALEEYRLLMPAENQRPQLVWPYARAADNQHFLDGVRKLGWTG